MFSTAVMILRGANWLNWILAAAFSALAVLTFAHPDLFVAGLAERIGPERPQAAQAVMTWLRVTLLLSVPVAAAVHAILTRLVALLRDAAAGDALSRANAARLRTAAWALLAINVADGFFGWLSVWASTVSGEYFGWSPSLTGWLTVLLMLILARVFEEGATMRDDLAGTV